jgi:integrase
MKTFALHKRSETRDAPWYFKFAFRGVVYPRCLQTNDASIAQQRARLLHKEITEAIIAGQFERLDGTRMRNVGYSSWAEVEAAYLRYPGRRPAPKTRRGNINCLGKIMADMGKALDVGAMTYDLLRAWKLQKAAFANGKQIDANHTRVLRTSNSVLRQARSVFSDDMREYFTEDCRLKLPGSLDKFLAVKPFADLPRIEYNPPSDEIIQRTLAAWEVLDDRNLFLAIGHELAFGLRIGEVAQAKWSWWTARQGYPVLDGEAHVKNKTGLVQVRALDPFYTIMRTKAIARGWLTGDFIILGSASYRADGLPRGVSDFLRGLGWQTQKTNHALRAYAGSQVAMKYGIYDAQTWLRHSSVKVTEAHYSHFVCKFKPANLDDIAAHWAVLDQVPVLTIVQQQL